MKKIGIVGQGNISGIYLSNIGHMFPNIVVAGTCDLVREKAETMAKLFGVPRIYRDMYELFDDPEVDIVLNITRPNDHYGVTKAALLAGKHVYSEKPLATYLALGKELVALAKERGLYLGGAPDTFMGAAIQTARKCIDAGMIGTPVGGMVHMLSHGCESWHPDPFFFYKKGGGPMLDMGPYYTTALLNLLGRASEVTAFGRASFPERIITSEPHNGEKISVEVETFTSGAIRFASGAIVSMTMSFDTWMDRSDMIRIFGSEGTLLVPDPNCFGGCVQCIRPDYSIVDIPLQFPYTENSRGLGLSDMADAIENGRLHRANSMQQLHALELMLSFAESERTHAPVTLTTPYERTAPMPEL